MRLNLGSSDRHLDGFTCVDIAPVECAKCEPQRVDLGRIWPWADSSVEEVMALDVCEHIGDVVYDIFGVKVGRSPGRIHFMNELHRVLIPGGRATIETPNAARGVGFWQDLTHCSPYCLSSFKYVEHGAFARERLGDAYGITARFRVLSLTESESNGEDPRERVWKIKAILEAVK